MVAKNFNFAVSEIFKHEGGYVDNKYDPGGATNMGITRKTLANWRAVKPYWKLAKSEVKALKKSEARAIYKALYWDRIAANKLPFGVDLSLFDFAVNSGVKRAAKTLQKLVKAKQDGIIGPLTLRALEEKVRKVGLLKIIKKISQMRLSFLRRLKHFKIFAKGWKRRIYLIEKAALKLAQNSKYYSVNNLQQPVREKEKMNFLSGYKTYIVGAFMLLAALIQFAGIELPGFENQAAMELVLQALAIIFLRKGIKSNIGGA